MKKLVIATFCSLLVLTGLFVFSRRHASKSVSAAAAATLPVVILDPGHGGFDGGAAAPDGTPEKDFNLAIALETRDALESRGFTVIMTREDDNGTEDPGLETIRQKKVSDIRNRMALMESVDRGIFVSIHQNYYEDASCSGAQIFYSGNTEESRRLAQLLQEAISGALQPGNTRAIKQSDESVYLLYHARIPAVMIECGFLSNADDVSLLRDPDYRAALASVIAETLYNAYTQTEDAYGSQE